MMSCWHIWFCRKACNVKICRGKYSWDLIEANRTRRDFSLCTFHLYCCRPFVLFFYHPVTSSPHVRSVLMARNQEAEACPSAIWPLCVTVYQKLTAPRGRINTLRNAVLRKLCIDKCSQRGSLTHFGVSSQKSPEILTKAIKIWRQYNWCLTVPVAVRSKA